MIINTIPALIAKDIKLYTNSKSSASCAGLLIDRAIEMQFMPSNGECLKPYVLHY